MQKVEIVRLASADSAALSSHEAAIEAILNDSNKNIGNYFVVVAGTAALVYVFYEDVTP